MSNRNPVLVYDGDCGFCEKTARLAHKWSAGRIEIRAWQAIPEQMAAWGLSAADGQWQAWFVNPAGQLFGGAAAVNQAMASIWWAAPFTCLYSQPTIAKAQEWLYRWVANHRYRLPGGSPTCQINNT